MLLPRTFLEQTGWVLTIGREFWFWTNFYSLSEKLDCLPGQLLKTRITPLHNQLVREEQSATWAAITAHIEFKFDLVFVDATFAVGYRVDFVNISIDEKCQLRISEKLVLNFTHLFILLNLGVLVLNKERRLGLRSR